MDTQEAREALDLAIAELAVANAAWHNARQYAVARGRKWAGLPLGLITQTHLEESKGAERLLRAAEDLREEAINHVLLAQGALKGRDLVRKPEQRQSPRFRVLSIPYVAPGEGEAS